MSVDPRLLRSAFLEHLAERDFWAHVASAVAEELTQIVRHLRLPAKVESRAKSTGSVIGKVMKDPDRFGGLYAIGDLAGVRAVVPFLDQVDLVAAEVHTHHSLRVLEDDTKTPPADKLAYTARHLQVELSPVFIPGDVPFALGHHRNVCCEVQLQTFAQNLWASSSHLVSYKRDPPEDVLRRVNRLVAIAEIFDDEVLAARDLALQAMDDVSAMAAQLSMAFTALTGHTADTSRTAEVVSLLIQALGQERQTYVDRLDVFLGQFSRRLEMLLTREDNDLPFIDGPEAVFLFERIHNAPSALRATWSTVLPIDELDRLEAAWGPD